MTTIGEKDCRQERVCVECGYRVAMPYAKRCPRCLTPLPVAESPLCGGCAQAAGCLPAQLPSRATNRK